MSDMDEPTAWEEINPTTALVRRPEPLNVPSASRLEPASKVQFRNELTACLALVAPVGMDEQARTEWLSVAWETLKHLPADLLAIGCRKAREIADHPSKIVPAIIAETNESMAKRRDTARTIWQTIPATHRIEEPDRCTPEQAKAILKEFGLASRFGSNRDA